MAGLSRPAEFHLDLGEPRPCRGSEAVDLMGWTLNGAATAAARRFGVPRIVQGSREQVSRAREQ
jgi:hypothetical protein